MKKTVCLLMLIGSAGFAFAHKGATGIVKERMDGMGVLAQSMKALVKMERSGDTDLKKAIEIANQIQLHAGEAMTNRFPEGDQQMVSEAAPAIWEDWARFEKISDELFEAALQLEANAVSGNVSLKLAIKELGATCSSCHEDFRIKKQN